MIPAALWAGRADITSEVVPPGFLAGGGCGSSWSCGAPERKSGPLLPPGGHGGGRYPGAPHPQAPPHPPTTACHPSSISAAVPPPEHLPGGKGPGVVLQPSSGLASAIAAGDETCVCPYCGKSLRDKYKVRRHIEDVHTPSSHSHQCSLCHRHYKTRNTLQNHMSIYHRPPRRPHQPHHLQPAAVPASTGPTNAAQQSLPPPTQDTAGDRQGGGGGTAEPPGPPKGIASPFLSL
ncbi:broad-complex core protein-like [Penaeus indicus]|uniref:broad-complex core protein-like n=1 Tax=Penaeus indicus TaxID=29960 RepID=UPI00300CCC91